MTHTRVNARFEGDYFVPIGDMYVDPAELQGIESRWLNKDGEDEVFQVFYNDKWLEACSIDFK